MSLSPAAPARAGSGQLAGQGGREPPAGARRRTARRDEAPAAPEPSLGRTPTRAEANAERGVRAGRGNTVGRRRRVPRLSPPQLAGPGAEAPLPAPAAAPERPGAA